MSYCCRRSPCRQTWRERLSLIGDPRNDSQYFRRRSGFECIFGENTQRTLEIVDVGVHGLSNVRSSIQFGYTRSKDAADGHVGDLSTANAMSKETFLASVQAGIDAVDRLADVNVLLLGELGIGT